jgi:hypothetical protein
MYVRFNVDSRGQVHLEQLLSFQDPQSQQSLSKWEKVPTTGLGEGVSSFLPLTLKCGIFLIDEKLVTYYGNDGAETRSKGINVIPALSISRIIPQNEIVRIETFDKKFFYVALPEVEFIQIYAQLLMKFKIVKIDLEGKIADI